MLEPCGQEGQIFALKIVQKILSSIFAISKVIKILMVRIGNFVTNQPTKPFNTNWYILRRHTLSWIVVLEKFMNFSELCCFLKITTAKTISRSKKSIFLRFKQILEKEVLWVYVVIILIVISKRGDFFKT